MIMKALQQLKTIIFYIAGLSALFLAILGFSLPGIPMTPFLLLSSFCFAKSSPKLHNYLLNHQYFGATIRDWQERGAITRKVKIIAIVMMGVSAIINFLILKFWLAATLSIIMFLTAIYIWNRPE